MPSRGSRRKFRTSISHDLANPALHLWPVAVNRTICALRFLDAERTAVEPVHGIREQFAAFSTQFPLAFMMVMAVDADHRSDGCPLANEAA